MNFSSQGKQLCIDDFKSSLEGLNKSTRAAYLEVIKCKKKSKILINKGKSRLLACLARDIRSFIGLMAINGSQLFDTVLR